MSFFSEELGFDVVIGEIELTECETVSRYTGTARPPCFKLPHYVDFQADLSLIRGLRAKRQNDKDI